jgi:hypothetical protein
MNRELENSVVTVSMQLIPWKARGISFAVQVCRLSWEPESQSDTEKSDKKNLNLMVM